MKQQHLILILAVALVIFLVYRGWMSDTVETKQMVLSEEHSYISSAIRQRDTVALRKYLDKQAIDNQTTFNATLLQVCQIMDKEGALNTKEKVSYAQARINNAQSETDIMVGVRALLSVVESDSNNVQALEVLGEMAIQSGQLQKAKERYQKLLNLQPQNAEYKQKLDSICEQMGEEC